MLAGRFPKAYNCIVNLEFPKICHSEEAPTFLWTAMRISGGQARIEALQARVLVGDGCVILILTGSLVETSSTQTLLYHTWARSISYAGVWSSRAVDRGRGITGPKKSRHITLDILAKLLRNSWKSPRPKIQRRGFPHIAPPPVFRLWKIWKEENDVEFNGDEFYSHQSYLALFVFNASAFSYYCYPAE